MEEYINTFIRLCLALEDAATSQAAAAELQRARQLQNAIDIGQAVVERSDSVLAQFQAVLLVRDVALKRWALLDGPTKERLKLWCLEAALRGRTGGGGTVSGGVGPGLGLPAYTQLLVAAACFWKRGWLEAGAAGRADLMQRFAQLAAAGAPEPQQHMAAAFGLALVQEFDPNSASRAALGVSLEFHVGAAACFQCEGGLSAGLACVARHALQLLLPAAARACAAVARQPADPCAALEGMEAGVGLPLLAALVRLLGEVLAWPFAVGLAATAAAAASSASGADPDPKASPPGSGSGSASLAAALMVASLASSGAVAAASATAAGVARVAPGAAWAPLLADAHASAARCLLELYACLRTATAAAAAAAVTTPTAAANGAGSSSPSASASAPSPVPPPPLVYELLHEVRQCLLKLTGLTGDVFSDRRAGAAGHGTVMAAGLGAVLRHAMLDTLLQATAAKAASAKSAVAATNAAASSLPVPSPARFADALAEIGDVARGLSSLVRVHSLQLLAEAASASAASGSGATASGGAAYDIVTMVRDVSRRCCQLLDLLHAVAAAVDHHQPGSNSGSSGSSGAGVKSEAVAVMRAYVNNEWFAAVVAEAVDPLLETLTTVVAMLPEPWEEDAPGSKPSPLRSLIPPVQQCATEVYRRALQSRMSVASAIIRLGLNDDDELEDPSILQHHVRMSSA
jgi:hypothetical protein